MSAGDSQAGIGVAGDIDGKILDIFRSSGKSVVSGQELSRLLNISRTAVWKHIKSLKTLGYIIESVPSQGYRLVAVPDTLIPAEIAAGLSVAKIGRKIICFKDTDSTNVLAYRLAEQGADEGTVVIADAQAHGKGRLGRRWESPRGVNLYCSIILRPPILPLHAPQLTFLSAVAVAEAIERTSRLCPAIKWPNDVLVNGFKVAGMLNEMSAETERVEFVILGIGVNINMRRDQFPADLRHPASSLLIEGGKDVDRTLFVQALLGSLDSLYEDYLLRGYEPLRDAWLARCNVMGRTVRVAYRDSETVGEVQGIDENGGLILRHADGRVERILAGDVTIVE